MIALLALACLRTPSLAPASIQAQNRLQLVPIVSDERLEYVEESVDGSRLITHDRGYAPKLWDPRTMRILRILGQGESIDYVTFSKNGEWVLTQSKTSVAIWDAARARRVATVQPMIDQDQFTVSAVSKDGLRCAAGTKKGWTVTFDIAKPDDGEWRQAHMSAVECLDWSPDSTKIATGAADGTSGIWDAKTQEFIKRFTDAKAAAQWIEWSLDGDQVLVTSRDNHARLYQAADAKLVLDQEHVIGEKGYMNNTLMAALFVGKAGDGVLTADRWGVMHITDRKTLKPLRTLPLQPPPHQTDSEGSPIGALREIRKSRDGRRIGTYSTDEKLALWDADTGKEYPFDREDGNPTAGEFSPNGEVFWVGYDDGTIKRHELETGRILSKTYGSIRPLRNCLPLGSDSVNLWTEYRPEGFMAWNGERTVWPVASLGSHQLVPDAVYQPIVASDNKHMLVWNSGRETVSLYELPSGKFLGALKELDGIAFSPDGSKILSWKNGKHIVVWSSSFEPEKEVPLKEEAKIFDLAPTPEAKSVVVVLNDGWVGEINLEKAGEYRDFGQVKGEYHAATVSRDGNWLAVAGLETLDLWDLRTSAHKSLKGIATDYSIGEPGFSSDSRAVALENQGGIGVWSVETGEQLLDFKEEHTVSNADASLLFSPVKPWVLHWAESRLEIWDYTTKTRVANLQLADVVMNAAFANNGKRLLTTDPTDGVVIWDLTTPAPKKLGAFLVMRSGEWLVMDTEGRYDASDPSRVEGASYVLEWEKGLEPIAVSQLKSQFYEPDLLKELMGLSSEAPRQVPDLSSLHLYPAVTLKPSKDDAAKVDISLEDRDEGGIGKVSVFLNGKQVFSKEGAGFIAFNGADYLQYMLPEPQLEGHGNILSVQAANEDGTLTSLPQSVDIGVPQGLKAPEVSLYALCVGVGDYAGNKSDLKSPPKDAEDLAKALTLVGNKLLPGRVHLTTLATDMGSPSELPTRANISAWFSDTAQKATSSDIVLVFLSGHGTSSIGSKRDYFFLTMEADPADVSEATALTGAMSGDELRAALAKVAATKQVVILDTCHSGAAVSDLVSSRSVSGDYQRAWEQIKDTTGTWLLAATASDTLSYESSSVDHGVLTYSLLEAIDKANADGLRPGSGGDLFVDVEQWLSYAVGRVDSLKNEMGIVGVQRPELRRSEANSSFSIGVTNEKERGVLGLRPPLPIILVGPFEQDQEDPLGLEAQMAAALKNAKRLKAWFDVAKHPNVYRVAGSYTTEGEKVTLKVVLQRLDADQNRKTLETLELTGGPKSLDVLAASAVAELEKRIAAIEAAKKTSGS